MKHQPLPPLERRHDLREALRPHCRLARGEVWVDPLGRHRVGCLDAADQSEVRTLLGAERPTLALQDPPYNQITGARRRLPAYLDWCRRWIAITEAILASDASLYVWIGADQRRDFQPLPDFMILMRETSFRPRSLITMRNQRGYGTPRNWMAVRQELLYYVRGAPPFDVEAEYTAIPKILRGYYKEVAGRRTENLERGRAPTLRAGNVWVDIQQVFYRLEENVSGCYAQKPLRSAERILRASSAPADLVTDFFCHSGSTLLAAERTGRRCCTLDLEPVFCEIAIRRLLHWRETGRTGWQDGNPFEAELAGDARLRALLGVRDKTRA